MRLSLGNEDNIREALFRYLFEHNESGAKTKVAAYCLSIEERDPDSALLDRFKEERIPVRRKSDCFTAADSLVRDRKSGQPALLFYVGEIRKLDNCGVEISGGYYEGNLSSSGGLYILVHEKGRWTVKVVHAKWIS